MYQGGYGQGFAGMYGETARATPAVPQRETSQSSNPQNVSDLFAQLQRQIPGFENIPTPRALTEQRGPQQEMKQAFKGVSRSNLFVQCINRDGLERGLKTDEQARVPNMNIFGTSRIQRNYKDFDVDLFSGGLDEQDSWARGAMSEPKEEKKEFKNVNTAYTQRNVNSQTPETYVPKVTTAEISNESGYISVQTGNTFVGVTSPHQVHQWQKHLMEYGSHEEHDKQDKQLIRGYSQNQNERDGRSRSPRRDEQRDRRGSRHSPGRNKRSPDRYRRRRSPERQRRSPERRRQSPERHRRSPERLRRSPERLRRSPERLRRSPERHRRSPERHRQSPEWHQRSRQIDRRFRRDKSPIKDDSKWSRDDSSPEERKRWVHDADQFTRAHQDTSLKELKTKDNLKREYESFIKGIGEEHGTNISTDNNPRESESDVFKHPLVPSVSRSQSSSKASRLSTSYSEVPPPNIYSLKSVKDKHQRSSRNDKFEKQDQQMNSFSGPDNEVFDDQLSFGRRSGMKKQPSKKHETFVKSQSSSSDRPNLSHFRTADVQSHYDNEREKIQIALATGKPSKEALGSLVDPRKPLLGKEIGNFIAKFIGTVGKSKKGVKIVAKKYHLPGNCIGLTPPKMTHEVWDILKKPAQIRDETLQDVQRWLSIGIIPVIHQIDLFGAGTQEAKDVCRITSDSLIVLGYVLLNLSIKRRLLMRSSLNKKYAPLCRTSNSVTSLLFGDNLSKDLIEIKFGTYQVERSKEEDNDDILSQNYKPTFFAGLAMPGADVDVNVANMINMACANEGDVEDLKEKYRIPVNCNSLVPAKINPEIWSLLSRTGLELDYKLQDVQLSVGEAMVPLMKLLESVHEKRYDPCEALGMLTDALALLGNSVFQLNKVRMESMMKTLPETAHNFCHWYWPGAEQVPGDNLQEELQDYGDANSERRAGLILGVLEAQLNQYS